MTTNKFWTIKDGLLGTAHINRNGIEVGFQQAEILCKNGVVTALSKDGFNALLNCDFEITKYWFDPRDWDCQERGALAKEIVIKLGDIRTEPIELFKYHNFYFYPTEEIRVEARNRLETRRELERSAKNTHQEKIKKSCIEFEEKFLATQLTWQQRKWLKNFLVNFTKSRQQVYQNINWNIPGGSGLAVLLQNRR